MHASRFWSAAGAVVLCLAVVGCTGGRGPGDGPIAVGSLAPDFELPLLDGGTIRLSDLRGKVVFLNFWATWCAPCREEIPMLNELQLAYGERGLDIIAISPEEADVLEEFQADNPVEYTSLIGTEELVHEYGALGYPTAFLIDGDGYVVDFFFGPKPRSVLEAKIEELLADS